MHILGVKPSMRTQFSGMFGRHNPGAVLIEDGEILAAAEEERFNRVKYSNHFFPEESIESVLDYGGISLSDVDYVAAGRDPRLNRRLFHKNPLRRIPMSVADGLRKFESVKTVAASYAGADKQVLLYELEQRFDSEFTGDFIRVPHHLSHAASARYCSGLDSPLTLTIDAKGEYDSTVVWDNELNRVKTFTARNSLGYFYKYGTQYLGYDYGTDAGKVMGLAPYGEHRTEFEEAFDELVTLGNGEYDVTNITDADDPVGVFEEYFGDSLQEPVGFEDRHKDFAYHLQLRTEKVVKHLVEYYLQKVGTNEVALAGGVAMNCKMNREVLDLDCVDSLFIQPAANDTGIPLGAALEAHRSVEDEKPSPDFSDVYLGPSYTNGETEEVLKEAKLEYEQPDDISKRVAELLHDGNIVGWFQGRMEFGARALGNRSILANPSSERYKDLVNKYVKHRESWRPFAPSLLYEDREEYLVNGDESPFMILVDEVAEEYRDKLEAITHVDGTTRPQTVRKNQNKKYYNMISEFKQLSGLGVVLNTSFNDSGEPIVETPQQAIQDYYATGMDALAIGDFLLEK